MQTVQLACGYGSASVHSDKWQFETFLRTFQVKQDTPDMLVENQK